MKVREAMTSDVSFCQPEANLIEAATIMWQRDCGVVPVADAEKRVIGMVTDRDICIAVATKNRLAADIKISEIIGDRRVKTCAPHDDAEDALKTMRKFQLRRLPVVNELGALVGVLSISDLLRYAGKGKASVAGKKVLKTLQDIASFRPLHLHELADEEIPAPPDETDDDADDFPIETPESETIGSTAETRAVEEG